ncbi:MAG: HU family DNA-binding protein [Aquificae bacterium]|nr:HU family DNA-binding protein [Aquificota bacterium]
MTKKEISLQVFTRLKEEKGVDMKKKEVYDCINEVFSILVEGILREEKVSISGFGSFQVKKRKPKKGMNLKEMKLIEIPERKVVIFRPSKNFIKE